MVNQHNRLEASNPATSAQRLNELANLPGDRGDINSDSGWCRESVATNPSTSPQTLTELSRDTDDFLVRKGVASNPRTPVEVVQELTQDTSDFVANTARKRLGQPLRHINLLAATGAVKITAAGIYRWGNISTGKNIS